MATDIAEVVGAALGLNLLFGIPLFPAGVIAGAGAFAILALQQMGFRRLEAGITALVGVVVASFVFELFHANPDGGEVAKPPLRAGLRRDREHPAGHRDHRRDGDAARRLPALGADPEADRRPRRRARRADPALREGRRGDRDVAGGRGQPLDDDRRRGPLPRQRPGRDRLDRRRLRRAQVAGLDQRGDGLRHRPAGLGLRLLLGRDDGRAGRDAGLHPAAHPDLRAPRGDPGAGAGRARRSASTRPTRWSAARSCSPSASPSRWCRC